MDESKPQEKKIVESENAARLEKFWEEMAKFQENEKLYGKSGHFLHTPGFQPKELVAEDMLIWEKVKDESLTPEEFFTYKEKFQKSGEGYDSSRGLFYQMAANKANSIFLNRSMDEQRQNKKQ